MQAPARPYSARRSPHPASCTARHSSPRGSAALRFVGILLLASLGACGGCTQRNPDVCCTSDTECAQLGLPPGSVPDYACGQGHVCRDFYCVPDEAPDASGPDAAVAVDAPSGRCNPNAPFGTPVRMANVNSQFEDLSMAMTFDQLKAYFVRSTGVGGHVIVTAKRESVESDFPAPTADPALAAVVAGAGNELYLYPSSDDLTIYYRRDQTWFASSRLAPNDPFDAGSQVYANGTPLPAGRAIISANSLTLYWSTATAPLRAATQSLNYNFVNQRTVTTFDLTDFAISADEHTLYYSNYPNPDVFRTTRSSKNVPFDVGVPVANVNTAVPDIPLYISPDDCFLYLRTGAAVSTSEYDIWVARRNP